jgi:hypothetical protein
MVLAYRRLAWSTGEKINKIAYQDYAQTKPTTDKPIP